MKRGETGLEPQAALADDRVMRSLARIIAVTTALLAAPSAATPATAAPLLCPPGETRISAHRARLDPAPAENSLRQMRRTTKAAPYMLEVDLSESREGTIYLLHDDDLDRTTGAKGPIATSSDAMLARARLRTTDGTITDEAMPTFAAAAAWARTAPDALLMLDIKRTPPAKIAPIVRAEQLTRRVLVLTFSPALAEQAIAADPDWLISVLVPDEAALGRYRTLFGKRRFAAYVPAFAPPALFAAARAAGAITLSDAMAKGPAGSTDEAAARDGAQAYARYLAERPVDILGTDHAGLLPPCLKISPPASPKSARP